MYSMTNLYFLNVLNLFSMNSAPDGWKNKNKVNMILNALSIRNVEAQIWRRVAPVKALCLQLSRDTRVVISDACETLAKACDDPGGLACLREQMCHPLATVVPFPQWPCGRQWASCGLKMIPHLTSSHVGCRECASLRKEGAGEEGRVWTAHIFTGSIFTQNFSWEPTPAASLYKVEKLEKWNWLISLEDFINFPPNMNLGTWSSYHSIKVFSRFFSTLILSFLFFFIRQLIKANTANNEDFKGS